MLFEAALELAVEKVVQRLVGRGLGCERAARGERENEGSGFHSTFPIFFTTSASFVASASQ